MKKSTILTFATAAAIVATSAGTFAAWDTLEAKSTGTVTLRKPATVTATAFDNVSDSTAVGTDSTVDVVAKFKVADMPTTGYKLTPSTKIKNGEVDVTSKFTVTYSDSNTDADINGEHNVTVTITPNDTDDEAKALAGTKLNVEVTGTAETSN